MLINLANVLGHRIANSIDLIEEDQAARAVTATLDAARELLGASKAMVYQVAPTNVENRPDVLRRFACSPTEIDRSRKREYEVTAKGVWTYVYEKNVPIWVINANEDLSKIPASKLSEEELKKLSDQTAGVTDDQAARCPALENQIPVEEDAKLRSMSVTLLDPFYNFVDKGSKTVITIPFKKTIEERDACWGIFDIEFDHPVAYSEEQFRALRTLTDHISSIAWKANAWKRTKSDTVNVIDEFKTWCERSSSAALSDKTGLWIKHRFSDETLLNDVSECFKTSFVQMDQYTLETKSTKLHMTQYSDIRQLIEKVHFGVVDLTRYGQIPELLFMLGLFAMKSRPCLVLFSVDSAEEFPSIETFSAQQTVSGQPDESLLHIYKYVIRDERVVFVCSGGEVDKRSAISDFLGSVRRQSSTFRAAHDHGPGN